MVFSLVVGCSTVSAIASTLQDVQFDVESVVPCRLNTPEESRQIPDDQRLLWARLALSSLLSPTVEAERIEYLFRLESPERTITVVDYEPKSSVRSPIVGDIQVQRSKQRSSTAGLSASGHLEGVAALDGSLGHNRNDSSELKYAVEPAAQQVAASGTLRRGSGAYFKFKPAPQQAREGARELQIVFRVPGNWRADYVRVLCEARDGDDPKRLLGAAHFIVALYRDDDPAARLAAERLLEAEHVLTDVAWKQRDQIERQRYSSRAHEWAANLDLSEPKIPQGWLYSVLHRLTTEPRFSFESRLPSDVKRAATEYTRAKLAVHQLAVQPVAIHAVDGGSPDSGVREATTERVAAKPIGPAAKTATQWTARKPKATAVD